MPAENPTTEAELIACCADIVAREKAILEKLEGLRFDVTSVGIPQFDAKQMESFHRLVATHAGLVKDLQDRASLKHVPVSLEGIRDVAKQMQADFGFNESARRLTDLEPVNTVISTLLTAHRAGLETLDRLHETHKEIGKSVTSKESYQAWKEASDLAFSACDNVTRKEPGRTALDMLECCRKVGALEYHIKNVHSNRWYNDSPQKQRQG